MEITGYSNTKELTFTFFPRLNVSSETRIFLLYPTVPDLTFRFISLGQHINIFPHAVVNFTQCITKSVLVTLDIFLNVYSAIYNILEIILKS